MELVDERSSKYTICELIEFLRNVEIKQRETAILYNINADSFKPLVAPVTWDGEPGNLNEIIIRIITGGGYLENDFLQILSMYRGFIAGELEINCLGEYRAKSFDVRGISNDFLDITNSKMNYYLSSLSSMVSRAMMNIDSHMVVASQVRYLKRCGFDLGSEVEINVPNVIVGQNNINYIVNPCDLVGYLKKRNLVNDTFTLIGNLSRRDAAVKQVMLIIYSVLFGECSFDSVNIMQATPFITVLPNKHGVNSNSLILIDGVRDNYFTRSYFASEFLSQFCISSAVDGLEKLSDYVAGTLRYHKRD